MQTTAQEMNFKNYPTAFISGNIQLANLLRLNDNFLVT